MDIFLKHQLKEFNNRYISQTSAKRINNRYISHLNNVEASKRIKGSPGANLKAMQKEGEYHRSSVMLPADSPFSWNTRDEFFYYPSGSNR